MGVVLYRKGSTHTIRGVECEAKVIDSRSFTGKAEEGWFLSEKDIDVKEKNEEEKDTIKEVEEIKTGQKDEILMSDAELRKEAEKRGVKGWRRASIKTLRAALE
jgi:hypothetical protein